MDKQSYGTLVDSPTGKRGKGRLPLVIMIVTIAVAALALLLAAIALGESRHEIRNLREELEELKAVLNITTDIEEDYYTLLAKVDSLSRLQNTAKIRLSTLHSTLDTLKTQVNSPQKNCTIKTTNCTIEPATNMSMSTVPSGEFWTGCWTSSLQFSNQVNIYFRYIYSLLRNGCSYSFMTLLVTSHVETSSVTK